MARTGRLLDSAAIILAIAVRVAAVLVLRSYEVPRSTYEHGEIAANLLAGRGFATRFLGADGPTSQQAPVYPLLVAMAYSIGGVGTPRALLLLELGQSILGGLLVWEVLRLARLVMPGRSWIARTAALVTAIHPTLIYAATHVQVASLGALLLTGTLAPRLPDPCVPTDSGRRDHRRLARRAGPDGSDPVPGNDRHRRGHLARPRRRARPGSPVIPTDRGCGLTGLVGISPWLVRNYRVHGEFVAIKSTFGYAFWQGNCALSEGTDKVLRKVGRSHSGTGSRRC